MADCESFDFSACSCGPMGCVCHPFSLKNLDAGKKRSKSMVKMVRKEQTASKRGSICKCGALGCGCAPLPDEDTGFKRDDSSPTSPHPVDLAIGWPFGYGPTFGWVPSLR